MRKRWFVLGALGVTCAALYACGTSNNSIFDTGLGGDASTGSDGSSGEAGGGFGTSDGAPVCSPACGAGSFCSVTNACVANGKCAANGDCTAAGTICDLGDGGTRTCIPGGNCGATKVQADIIPPNILITLDRSCSMTDEVDLADGGKATKWSVAVSAINTLTTNYKGQIRFGLILFPDKDGANCTQQDFPYPTGAGNEKGIQDLLNAALLPDASLYPAGPCVTNIDTALEQAATTDPGLADKTRGDFVVLLTDGEQSGCNSGGGAPGAIQAVHDLYVEAGVPTFAVGFGTSADPVFLSAIAVEGGTAPQDAGADASAFFNATDQAALLAAFQTIAQKALGCSLALGTAPPDPSKLYVFVNGSTQVPRDPTHTNGWDYDPTTNTVTFYGAECTQLKAGTVSGVDVEYGCPQPGAK